MRNVSLLVLTSLLLHGTPAFADEAAELRAMVARGERDAAVQRAERAVAANPRDANPRFGMGVLLMDLGRDSAALEAFTRLSEEYPELPDPFNNIALLRARGGDFEGARLALESALRNDPGHRLARANLGQVHLMLAVQAWERLGALGPLDLALQRRLDAVRTLVAAGAAAGR